MKLLAFLLILFLGACGGGDLDCDAGQPLQSLTLSKEWQAKCSVTLPLVPADPGASAAAR